ncbi:MAG TPA: hypothetical protein VGL86_29260 [Polyangia bacterium]|jgi:hypothetical protein
MRRALVAVVLMAGCYTSRYAIVHGERVERPSFGYTDGNLFAVEHRRAYPDVFAGDRPSYVDDGELGGRACGLELTFFSEWYGNMMTLYGRGNVPLPWATREVRGGLGVTLTIEDHGSGHIHIRGSTNTKTAFPIDIDVGTDRLVAQIGTRNIDLHAAGHYLIGRLVQHDVSASVDAPFVIYGREMLRTMVPADETLILLLMITCNSTIEYNGRAERGFSLVSNAVLGAAPAVGSSAVVDGPTDDHGGLLAQPPQYKASPSAASGGIGGVPGGAGHR